MVGGGVNRVAALHQAAVAQLSTACCQRFARHRAAAGQRRRVKRGIVGGNDVPRIGQGIAQAQIQALRLNIAPVRQVAAPQGKPTLHQQQAGVIERVEG